MTSPIPRTPHGVNGCIKDPPDGIHGVGAGAGTGGVYTGGGVHGIAGVPSSGIGVPGRGIPPPLPGIPLNILAMSTPGKFPAMFASPKATEN